MFDKLKKNVYDANKKLSESNLTILNWGNVSEIDTTRKYIAIKPSGISYENLKQEDIVIVDLDGNIIDGKLNPSVDLPTHIELYKHFNMVNGICHTHSPFATSYAQAGVDIPVYGTTHADVFYGAIPCTNKLSNNRILNDYEKNTGLVIIEEFSKREIDSTTMPGAIVCKHGPFTWGKSAEESVFNAIILEEIAKINIFSLVINKNLNEINECLLDKHFLRKHGKSSYYGQHK